MKGLVVRQKILQAGKDLIQRYGFDGISFRDIAKIIAIKTSSIHYHFPTKIDLAVELIRQEIENLEAYLDPLQNKTSSEKIRGFIKLFELAFKKEKFCLCGILIIQLKEPKVEEVLKIFFDKCIQFCTPCFQNKQKAIQFVALCEGGLLVGRIQNASFFQDLIAQYT